MLSINQSRTYDRQLTITDQSEQWKAHMSNRPTDLYAAIQINHPAFIP